MATVIDIVRYAAETVGDVSDEMLDFGRRAIRMKYQTFYKAHLWRESLRVINSVLDPSLNGVFFLPYDTEEVIFFSISNGAGFVRMNYRERDWVERHAIWQSSVPGGIPTFHRAENLAWPYFNPGQFTFTSYDTGIFTLFIGGLNSDGSRVSETYKMQAIVNPGDKSVNPAIVTTTHSFVQISDLSKGITSQPLLVQPQFPVGGAPVSMPPGQTDLAFTQLVLTPTPILFDSNHNPLSVPVRLQVKLKADTLGSDFAVPRISHITDGLTEFVLAAMYRKAHQLTKSDSCEQKAIQHIQAAVNVEKNQSEMRQQVVPVIYDTGSYVGRGAEVSSSYPWGW
jgi:hypothetical protein